MVDGTGMCGACRLTIGGKTKFVCIDGPEFDGALVDWDEMFKRMGTFKRAEQEEVEHYQEHVDEASLQLMKLPSLWRGQGRLPLRYSLIVTQPGVKSSARA